MPGKRKVSNCLTKSDLQKIQAQKNWRMDINKILSFTISELKDSLPKSSRTSRLWINYMNCINIVKISIRAGRTGNLHLLPT